MAFVRIYFHREPKRVAPHVRYIAGRENSRGLRGLGPAFRALNGDVERAIQLLREHAAIVHSRAGDAAREGPFVRLLFTLPDALAARADAVSARLPKGSQLVLQDAVEATFRSVGRHLQGVYAVHFHATGRRSHPHVHVDLSPLDTHGRTVFITARQRELFRATWEREIVKALERAERRAMAPQLQQDAPGRAPPVEPGRGRGAAPAGVPPVTASAPPWARPEPEERLSGGAPNRTTPAAPSEAEYGGSRRRPARATHHGWSLQGHFSRHAPTVASILLGTSHMPLLDLFTRALVARTRDRVSLPFPDRMTRLGLALQVPVRNRLPLPSRHFTRPQLFPLRWP